MTSIYELKPAFQNVLRPLTNLLAHYKVTANQITIIAVLLSLVTGLIIVAFPTQKWPLLLVPCMLLLRMGLNAIDGMLAREHHMQSSLGTFLNELGDVLSDIFIYLPFACIPGISTNLIIAIVMLAIIAEMTGVIAVQIAIPRRYDGPMGKSDRALVFGIAALLAVGGQTTWLNFIFSLVACLLLVTIFNRVTKALRAHHEYQQ